MSSHRNVILNLAEPEFLGPVGLVQDALKTRNPARSGIASKLFGKNTAEVLALIPLLQADLNNTLKRTDLAPHREAIRKSDKVLLCTHGIPNDTNHAYLKASGGAPLCNYEQLARFILAAFPKRSDPYHLALVMCYGARTATFKPSDLDQQSNITQNELITSFAYKLYKRICIARDVKMTARTGAVQFDAKTGRSLVEQEVSVGARISKEEYLRSPAVNDAIDRFVSVKDSMCKSAHGGSLEKSQQFAAWGNAFKANPNANLTSTTAQLRDKEEAVRSYQQVLGRKHGYADQMNAHQDLGKYGKIVYEYSNGNLIILNKYGAQSQGGVAPNTVLYSGPLV